MAYELPSCAMGSTSYTGRRLEAGTKWEEEGFFDDFPCFNGPHILDLDGRK